jgi:hypothetical protein
MAKITLMIDKDGNLYCPMGNGYKIVYQNDKTALYDLIHNNTIIKSSLNIFNLKKYIEKIL